MGPQTFIHYLFADHLNIKRDLFEAPAEIHLCLISVCASVGPDCYMSASRVWT